MFLVLFFLTNQTEIYCSKKDKFEGEKNHKKGGLNCVFKNFSFLRSKKLFPDSESEIVQSLTRVQSLSVADKCK